MAVTPGTMRMGTLPRLLLVLIPGAMPGCSQGELGAPNATAMVTDSMGVEIVVNPLTIQIVEWTIADAPALVIGGDEMNEEQQLYSVTSATRLPSGIVVIANDGTGQLLAFGSEGERISASGGRGEGPGEFDRMTAVHVLPGMTDTIVAEGRNFGQHRLSFFAPDGELVRERRAPPSTMRGAWYDYVTSPGGDTFALLEPLPERERPISDVARRRAYLVRMTLDNTARDTLGSFQGTTYRYADIGPRAAFGGGVVTGPRSITPMFSPMAALGGGGHPFRVAVGDQATASFSIFESDGTLIRRVHWSAVGRKPTPRDIKVAKATYGSGPGNDRGEVRRALDAMPAPERTPVFRSIRIDRLAYIWVEQFPLPTDDVSAWWIFDPQGQLTASVRLPSRLQVLEIGADYVLVLTSGNLGVHRVEMYGLQRTESGSQEHNARLSPG